MSSTKRGSDVMDAPRQLRKDKVAKVELGESAPGLEIKKANDKKDIYRIRGTIPTYDLTQKASFLKLLGVLDQAYHNQIRPYISDQEYDKLVERYELQFDEEYVKCGAAPPPTKPTTIAAAKAKKNNSNKGDSMGKMTKGNPKIKRLLPWVMPSLRKIKTNLELSAWVSRIQDECRDPEADHYSTSLLRLLITNKIDGISALLYYYSNGLSAEKPTQLLMTRGDGRIGYDISHLLPFQRLPNADVVRLHRSSQKNVRGARIAAIRMELVLKKKDFEALKAANVAAGGKDQSSKFNDARTTLAGIVNSTKDISVTAASSISCIAYEVFYVGSHEGVVCRASIEDEMADLTALGFEVPHPEILSPESIEYEQMVTKVDARRTSCECEMDGLVISAIIPQTKVAPWKGWDSKRLYPTLDIEEEEEEDDAAENSEQRDEGTNVEKPWHMIALKPPGESVQTRVDHVSWRVTRHGVLFPRVHVKMVHCGAVDIDHATGKSARFIKDNRIGPGSLIEVAHSGSTIPDILDVLGPASSGKGQMPGLDAPAFQWNKNRENLVVLDMNCIEVQRARVASFFDLLKADNIGDSTSDALFDHFNGDLCAILSSSVEDLIEIDGFQQRKAEVVHESMHKCIKKVSLVRLMIASSCFSSGLGPHRFQSILDEYPDVLSWKINDEEEEEKAVMRIQQIPGFKKLANQFITKLPIFQKWLDKLPMIQFEVQSAALLREAANAKGEVRTIPLPKSVCFTKYRNAEWEREIKMYGGKVTGSVLTGKQPTEVLIVRQKGNMTTKEKKAIAKGIRVMTAGEFAKHYGLRP